MCRGEGMEERGRSQHGRPETRPRGTDVGAQGAQKQRDPRPPGSGCPIWTATRAGSWKATTPTYVNAGQRNHGRRQGAYDLVRPKRPLPEARARAFVHPRPTAVGHNSQEGEALTRDQHRDVSSWAFSSSKDACLRGQSYTRHTADSRRRSHIPEKPHMARCSGW